MWSSIFQDLVYAILITNHQLITLVRMKHYFLHPLDLHLIFNLVSATESFKAAESWTPICLPKFDSKYVSSLVYCFQFLLLSLSLTLITMYKWMTHTHTHILYTCEGCLCMFISLLLLYHLAWTCQLIWSYLFFSGYLHAYISYLDESCDACLLLLTVDKDLFFTLSDCKRKIMEVLL